MPESSPRRAAAAACVAAGVALTFVAATPVQPAWLAAGIALLAQPLLGLGVARLRGRADVPIYRHAMALLLLWAGALAGTVAVLAWPLAAALRSGSLPAALALSLAVGIVVLVLWPAWPVWTGVERDGDLRGHWRDMHDADRSAWRGLGIAACVLAISVGLMVLGWPGLLDGDARWVAGAVLAVLAPLAHAGIQWISPAVPGVSALHATPGSALGGVSGGIPTDAVGLHGLEIAAHPATTSIERGGLDAGDATIASDTSMPQTARNGNGAKRARNAKQREGRGADSNVDAYHAATTSATATATAPTPTPAARVETSVVAMPASASTASPPDPAALVVELYEAARGGRVDRALALVDAGADVHAAPPAATRDQRSLPVLAAVLPDLRLLRALIAKGVDINAAHAGMTPLLAATRDSWHGRPDAVMTLLSNGADPRQRDGEGNTALHFAARSTDPGVAALLRDAAAELEAVNADGLSPLGMACAAGNWRVARFLLERGARPEPPGGQPALLAAAGSEDDDPAGVVLLLKSRARVDARDAQGRSALHVAAHAGHETIASTLIEAGADPALADAAGRTPLMEAARGGSLDLVELLLAQLPDGGTVQAQRSDADGRNLLALACEAEAATPELIERLLALGADPAQVDRDGKRPIDRAAEAGRWALVASLDAGYRLPAALRDDDNEPLPDRAPLALLREGLQEGHAGLPAIAALLSPAELGLLLHDDAIVAEPSRIDWLLAHGADPQVADSQGQAPLFVHMARGAAGLAALRRLLDAGVSPSGRGGLARFLAHCTPGDAAQHRLARELLDRGADPFGLSRAGDPPLTLAVRLGWTGLVERLLQSGVNLDLRDSRGISALHLAAALGRVETVKCLIAHGACPDLRATDGQTPLGVALAGGRRDIADWLDWRGWPLPRRPLRGQDVPAAAIAGDVDALRRLLDLGLDVDAVDRQGCSALLRAAGGGHREVLDLLLARGADPGLAAQSGATPLSAAVSMQHVDIVGRLVTAGVSLEQRLPGDLTVLMVASALGLPDLVNRLLAAGADVDATDAQGRGALHCAAMYGFSARERSRVLALLDALVLAGGDIDASAAGATPLLMLLGARAEPGTAADEDVVLAALAQLLAQDASLSARDARGFGPLHLAALHGLPRVVAHLLQAGADAELRDSLGRTPREIAVMRGFVDIAAELGPSQASRDISMARFLRDR